VVPCYLYSEREGAAPVGGAEDGLEQIVDELLHGALGGEQPGGVVSLLCTQTVQLKYYSNLFDLKVGL